MFDNHSSGLGGGDGANSSGAGDNNNNNVGGFHNMSVRDIRRRSSLLQMDVPRFRSRKKKGEAAKNEQQQEQAAEEAAGTAAAAGAPKERGGGGGAESTEGLDDTESTNSLVHQLADLFGKHPNSKISRSDLYRMILDRVSVRLDVEVMEAIFDECDADDSGLVSIEQLRNFIRQDDDEESSTSRWKRHKAIMMDVLWSLQFWCFLFFAAAELTSFCYTLRWKLLATEEAEWNYVGFYNYLLIIGSYGFVAEIHDEFASELRLIEKAKAKVLLFVKENALSIKSRNAEMSPKALSAMLERGGLYLPSDTLMDIFEEIDDDGNGSVTFDELLDYAEAFEKRGKLSDVQFHLKVLQTCFVSWDYWLEWGWLVAAVLNLITSYTYGVWSDDTTWIIDGTAYSLYLLCALWQHKENYKYAEKTFQQKQDMKKALETMVVQIGSQTLARDGRASEEIIADQMSYSLRHNDPSAETYCRVVYDRLFSSASTRRLGFQNEHDGEGLDFIAIYDALTQAGFVIELEILRSIFDKADTDGNGLIDPEEFVDYILKIVTTKTKREKTWKIIKLMLAETEDFWAANFELIGAVLLVTSNFAEFKSFQTEVNMWLASDFFWFIPAFYLAFRVIPEKAAMYDALAFGKSMFRKAMNQALVGNWSGPA